MNGLFDLREILAALLLAAGAFVLTAGAVGQARFPDFYTRLHALTPTTTLGGGLILIALAVEAWDWRFGVRLALFGLLVLTTAPAIAHMLANAAHAVGLSPRVGRLRIDNGRPPS
jgi:multicomponent Na+:H+ antiporter subunit G